MAGVPGFVVLLLLLVSAAHVAQSDNLQDACNKTLFPKVCIQALTTNPETRTADAHRLAELSVYVAKEVGTTVAAFAHHELNGVKEDKPLFKCLDSCSDDVEEAVAHLSALTRELTNTKFLEVKSWLSATLGGSSTCEESCKDAPISDVKNAVVTKSLEFEKLLRVTLDLITEASGSMSSDVAVPPTAWDASAPGSYGASVPESSESASAPGSDGSSAPEASDSASAPKASDSASAPKASDSAKAPASSDSAKAPASSDSAKAPASSDSASAPGSYGSSAPDSGAPSSDAASPSNAPTSEAPSTDAPAPSYGSSAASGPSADTPSSSAPDADAPSSGDANAPSSGDAGAPSSGDAGAPSSGDAGAPSYGAAGAPSPSPSGASAPEADSPA